MCILSTRKLETCQHCYKADGVDSVLCSCLAVSLQGKQPLSKVTQSINTLATNSGLHLWTTPQS